MRQISKSIEWLLTMKRPNDGNDVQIGAGKFIHYYTPDKLPTMAKHVIFVIDISGSMSGRKLEQTKDALLTMLDEMKQKNIGESNIIFSFHENFI